MRRVLVTGASGNVGSEVVRACLAAGLEVRAASRVSADSRVSRVALDFLSPATWAAALEGCEAVFLMRPPPISDMQRTLIPFVEQAYAAGVRHVVFLSVMGAERMAWVPHRKLELHLEAKALGFTLLRPGFFAQNFQDAYQRDIVEDSRVYVPAGDGKIAFLDAADIGDVAARVLLEPARFSGKALTLTGPEAVTFEHAARLLTAVLGRPIRYEPASVLGYVRHLRARRRLPLAPTLVQTFLHYGLRGGDAEPVLPTVTEVLGRPARTLQSYFEANAARWASAAPRSPSA